MSLLSRDPAGQNPPAHSYPIARGFACVLLTALIILIVLRHLFGSIRLEGGTR